MLCLSNAFNDEEFAEFDTRVHRRLGPEDVAYVCEPKLDGLAVELVYEDGQLRPGRHARRRHRWARTSPRTCAPSARCRSRSGARRGHGAPVAARGARRGLHPQGRLQEAQRAARGGGRAALRQPAQRRRRQRCASWTRSITAARPLSFFAYELGGRGHEAARPPSSAHREAGLARGAGLPGQPREPHRDRAGRRARRATPTSSPGRHALPTRSTAWW